jgi:hypothetical protein
VTDETPAQSADRARETRELIARVLYMIVFGFAFWACSIVLALAAILQLLMVAFTRERNDNLTALGRSLGEYVREIVRYLTFVTDEPPFPFGEWPESSRDRIEHGG